MALVDNAWYVDYGNGSSTGYYAVTAWAASTTKTCGALIRQATTPSVGNERVLVCVASTSGTGTTGSTEPTWTVTRGAKNTDNGVTWQEATGVAALNGDLTNTPTWTGVKNKAVTLGQVIQNVAGTLILICTTAGTTGSGAEPSWAAFTAAGATTADNTATWTTLGSSFAGWSAPHARLGNAFATNWGQPANSFFVASEHAETQSITMSLTAPGTSFSVPCYVYCVGKTHVPPSASDLTTGATITTTSGAITLNGSVNGSIYWYGIKFQTSTGASSGTIAIASSGIQYQSFQSCAFSLNNTASSSTISLVNAGGVNQLKLNFRDCTFSFGAAGQSFSTGGASDAELQIVGGAISGTAPTSLFTAAVPALYLKNVDLSLCGSGSTLFHMAASYGLSLLQDCKLGASVAIATTPLAPNQRVMLVRSDSAATSYRTELYGYAGTQTTETSVVRTGGASDGTTGVSWKIATNANANWVVPFESVDIGVWNANTATNVTVTLHGTWNQVAVPNTDDIWIEVEYFGASGTPLGSLATSTKANNLVVGSALTADSVSSWGGGGSGAGWSPFSLSVTLSSPQPQHAGYIRVTVKAGKASSTFYVDPLAVLS